MYQTHWGLHESPFRPANGTRSFHRGPTHEEALARLDFLVEQHRRLGLLLGEAGSGKSWLLAVFAEEMRRAGRVAARVSLLALEADEFLSALASELGATCRAGHDRARLWRSLADRLEENRLQELITVVLLDDADTASPEVLAQVLRLAQFDEAPPGGLTIVLASYPETLLQLGPRLLDLAELRVDLPPWDEAESAAFVRAALIRAGGDAEIFEPAALERLHELSGGVPRRVGQLAELALAAGAGQQLQRIDADLVEAAYSELGMVEVG